MIFLDDKNKEVVEQLFSAFARFHRKDIETTLSMDRRRSEAKLLMLLHENKQGLKISDLSRLMRVTSPFVTQIVTKLESTHLLVRQHDLKDRRIVRVQLTEKGECAAQEVGEKFYEKFKKLTTYLGEKESEQLAFLLNQAFDFFNEEFKNDKSE